MTMTTCHPKFTASHRMILHAVLDKKIPSNANHPSAMPAPVQTLYSPGSE
jgi:hypothetical protein